MEPLSLVLYQNDPGTAQTLVVSLSQHFESVYLVSEYEETDSPFSGIAPRCWCLTSKRSRLSRTDICIRNFPRLCIVATHRLADEQVWTEALNQGAADVCEPRQIDALGAARAHAAGRKRDAGKEAAGKRRRGKQEPEILKTGKKAKAGVGYLFLVSLFPDSCFSCCFS